MDTASFLGAHGGQLALAFGSGCVAGYGFCMRTIYKLLETKSDKEHQECLNRIIKLEQEKAEMSARLELIEDRMFVGQERQLAQIRQSTARVLPELIDARQKGYEDDGL